MSGGQKARIALARAMYARCGVVLLDDPLSALDNIVGGWVFRRAVLEMASDAAVVMATHQHQARRSDPRLRFGGGWFGSVWFLHDLSFVRVGARKAEERGTIMFRKSDKVPGMAPPVRESCSRLDAL